MQRKEPRRAGADRVVRNVEQRIQEALDDECGWGGPFTKEQQQEKVQRQGDEAAGGLD
jgi:hypothetical protein